MTEDQREKLLQIRVDSKLGRRLSQEEQTFCEQMYKKFPKEYGLLDVEINKIVMRYMNPLYREK